MSLDSETWDQKWEKTQKRGKLCYLAARGVAFSAVWFVANLILKLLFKDKMSYGGMALESLFFFLFGCWDAQSQWNDAQRRYWDMVRLRNSMIEDQRLRLEELAARQLNDNH